MSYANRDDMIEAFGEEELVAVTNRDAGATSIDDAVLDKALVFGQAEIDSMIGGRVKLPLTVVPTLLVARNCDIARWYLYKERATEAVTKRYEAAVAWLKMVAKGEVVLGLDPNDQETPTTDLPVVSAPDRVFTGGTLKEFLGS